MLQSAGQTAKQRMLNEEKQIRDEQQNTVVKTATEKRSKTLSPGGSAVTVVTVLDIDKQQLIRRTATSLIS
jgi:outer membrane cobalamin receptor